MASVQYDDSAFYLLVLALLCMYLVPGARSRHPPFGRLTCWFELSARVAARAKWPWLSAMLALRIIKYGTGSWWREAARASAR